ncbi:MAG: acyl-CoA dehydratase activase [Terriglobales bacterium]
MQRAAGIDCGAGFTKAVIVFQDQDQDRPRILGKGHTRSGVNLEEAATLALGLALDGAGLQRSAIDYVASTGFGRYNVGFRDIQITEITSAARGARYLLPQTQCVLDIGSQSTRAVGLQASGKVRAFKTNDKCAAGSGMFIVRAAKYLEVDLERVGELSLQAVNPQPISSVCAVLAESEIINHLSAGVGVEDILRGIHDSLTDRALPLLRRAGFEKQLTLIGGVARQQGMVRALQERLGIEVDVPEDCEYVCALGAALLGLTRLRQKLGPPLRDAATPVSEVPVGSLSKTE